MSTTAIAGLSVLILFPVVIWYFFEMKAFISWLQKNDPEKWRAWGSPTLFANNSPRSSFNLVRALFAKEFIESISDQSVKSNIVRMRLLLVLGVALTGIIFACAFSS